MITDNEINEYIKKIKKQLLYGTKESRLFLKELKQNILDFADENKDADMAAIRQQFGSEEEVANAYFETADIKTIKKKMNIKRLITVLVVAVIAVLCIWSIVTIINTYVENIAYCIDYPAIEEYNSTDFTQEQYTDTENQPPVPHKN